MNISIDSDGNVTVDKTYSTTGIDTINTRMNAILATIKTFDPAQITTMTNTLNTIYPQMVNFEQFLTEWEDVLSEVIL